MTQHRYPNWLRLALDGEGGGTSAPAAPAPAATPAAPKPAATSSANPFQSLARKAGIQPQHTGLSKPPVNTADKSLTLDGDMSADLGLPKPEAPKNKPKPAQQQPQEFDDSMFDDDGSESEPPTPRAAEVQPPAEDEEEAEQKPEQKEEEQQEQEKPADKPKPQFKLKLEELEPEDRAFAKKMHSSAVEHFATKVKNLRNEIAKRDTQLQQIEQSGLPLSYYSHPEGYRLHPEYKQTSESAEFAQKESTFWRRQLIAVENGQPFQVFRGVDNNGNDIIEGPFQPTPEAKIQLQEAMMLASQAVQQNRIRLQQLQSAFKTDFEKGRGTVKQGVDANFAWLQKPEVDKATVPVVGADGKQTTMTVAQLKENVRNNIPAMYRDHPLADVVVPLFTAYNLMQIQYQRIKAKIAKHETTQQTVALSEPPTNGDTVTTTPRTPKTAVINGKRVADREFKFNPLDTP